MQFLLFLKIVRLAMHLCALVAFASQGSHVGTWDGRGTKKSEYLRSLLRQELMAMQTREQRNLPDLLRCSFRVYSVCGADESSGARSDNARCGCALERVARVREGELAHSIFCVMC